MLSLQSVLHWPSVTDVIDVSIRETGADWRGRSIPLHLACVVSTCLGPRQTLREIVWSRDERGLLFSSEPVGLHRDWAHRFDLLQLHGRMSAPQILAWTLVALELVKHALCHRHPCFTFTQLACGLTWELPITTAVLFPALMFTHSCLFTSVYTSGKNTSRRKLWFICPIVQWSRRNIIYRAHSSEKASEKIWYNNIIQLELL